MFIYILLQWGEAVNLMYWEKSTGKPINHRINTCKKSIYRQISYKNKI